MERFDTIPILVRVYQRWSIPIAIMNNPWRLRCITSQSCPYQGKALQQNLKWIWATAHIMASLASFRSDDWDKAERLLKDAVAESCQQNNLEQKWRCNLDLAHLYSPTWRPERALATLKPLREFELRIKDNKPGLVCGSLDLNSPSSLQKQKRLTFMKQVEYGRAYMTRAEKAQAEQGQESKELKPALQQAKIRFDDAKLVHSARLPYDFGSELELEVGRARVLSALGSLEESGPIISGLVQDLGRSCKGASGRSGSKKPLWDILGWKARMWLEYDFEENMVSQ
ncbi:hypothetical protein GQ44DRAFT_243959 [Phaeosphaeriaceae sp. PMI808]|nr:hypothetical protein GQ44DRAFT_243959 [Phaeosphaeriaceae sp. PMI808]